jgi:hypothetical protein
MVFVLTQHLADSHAIVGVPHNIIIYFQRVEKWIVINSTVDQEEIFIPNTVQD